MNLLTNLLYWISTAFLIPVIVLLLFIFIRALISVGILYGTYLHRIKFTRNWDEFTNSISNKFFDSSSDTTIAGNIDFSSCIQNLIGCQWHSIHSEKIISDFELLCEKKLMLSKTFLRIGPMLGLMGTLIPMGPALVGLASGDIASMALNMQVAFSTTVIGIFIGAIGFVQMMIYQRWYSQDISNLEYLYQLSQEHSPSKSKELD